MIDETWFGDSPSVGELNDADLAAYLESVADPEWLEASPDVVEDRLIEERLSLRLPVISGSRPFKHTGTMVGYLREDEGHIYRIVDPRELGPDRTLIGSKVALRLTEALVVRYPGRGVHEILLHFGVGRGSDRTPKHNFSATIRAADNNLMPLGGQVLFSGIEVAEDGVSVAMSTVNVHSEGDTQLLQVLQSDVFQKGLDLAASTGPVVGLLSTTLDSLAKHIASGSENKKVQTGFLGLDLNRTLVDTAKLRTGTYVMAQAPARVDDRPWNWSYYIYDRSRNAIVHEADRDRLIEFNYVAVGIQKLTV